MTNYLLLLHGYTQNGNIMKEKVTKMLSSNIMKTYEILSPNGPYHIVDEKFGWWKLDSPEMYSQPHTYENYVEAIKTISNTIKHLKEDDILTVIGFSQGAVLAEILIQQKVIHPDKLVLLSPSGIMDSGINTNTKNNFENTKILVMIGENENIFNINEQNYRNNTIFPKFQFHLHKQGHVIPSQSDDKKIIKTFLDNF